MSKRLASRKFVKKAEETLTFWTANRKTDATYICEEKALGLKRAGVKDTLAILSLGIRCMQLGYGFYWFPHELPYLVCPSDGRHVQLQLDNFMPRLPSRLDGMPVKLGHREVSAPWVLSSGALAFSATDRLGGEEDPPEEMDDWLKPFDEDDSESEPMESSAEDAGRVPGEDEG